MSADTAVDNFFVCVCMSGYELRVGRMEQDKGKLEGPHPARLDWKPGKVKRVGGQGNAADVSLH